MCESLSCVQLCSPPVSSVHGILQARILEWVAISFLGDLPDLETEPGPPLCRQIIYGLSHLRGCCFGRRKSRKHRRRCAGGTAD